VTRIIQALAPAPGPGQAPELDRLESAAKRRGGRAGNLKCGLTDRRTAPPKRSRRAHASLMAAEIRVAGLMAAEIRVAGLMAAEIRVAAPGCQPRSRRRGLGPLHSQILQRYVNNGGSRDCWAEGVRNAASESVGPGGRLIRVIVVQSQPWWSRLRRWMGDGARRVRVERDSEAEAQARNRHAGHGVRCKGPSSPAAAFRVAAVAVLAALMNSDTVQHMSTWTKIVAA
jgi:hypothetical protein